MLLYNIDSTIHRLTLFYVFVTINTERFKGGGRMTAKECGRFIADLRKEKNLTQRQLADILNVSDKAVSRWETGKGFPDVTSLISLSDFFGISVNEILAGKRAEIEALAEIADKNVIDAFENNEKEVKKKKIQTIICIAIFSIILVPPAIPTFIFLIDEFIVILKKYLSFENLSEFIVWLTIAILLSITGLVISKGHISLLHAYHYKNVTDREGYCKAMGKTFMLMGIPIFISSFSALFPSIHFVQILGNAILFFGLIVGCGFLFKFQYKYNGGLF